MVILFSDFGLMGGLAFTGISRGNSVIRIFGIHPTAGGMYPGPKIKSIQLKTVLVFCLH